MTEIQFLVLFVVFAVILVWRVEQAGKKTDTQETTMSAAQAEAWSLDYHNPASVNYDPVRTAADKAAATKVLAGLSKTSL